ncbi:hypothetical protein C2R22_21865 (plasmid) [Salinigranum rubrum]|uniref:Uncharacterized protein n=1 Tax=Salinigranum rubrum TaxID=755307 RepID=A0A2I8VQQ7_9EURY|nr:hypothetical protein [Salinigranum rubrum]AUV84214.1 hypothetical protein C2R22_21865 [Salinigranum rubrum]
MTGQDASSESNSVSSAPIDFDRLDLIRDRFATDERFTQIVDQPEFASERLVCVYDTRFYPSSVQNARVEIVWFENGDFSLHYYENHVEGTFDHRWDRHPSDHNARDHIHPGPDAPTPGDDSSHPSDWRDVLSMALAEIEARQRAFWDG